MSSDRLSLGTSTSRKHESPYLPGQRLKLPPQHMRIRQCEAFSDNFFVSCARMYLFITLTSTVFEWSKVVKVMSAVAVAATAPESKMLGTVEAEDRYAYATKDLLTHRSRLPVADQAVNHALAAHGAARRARAVRTMA